MVSATLSTDNCCAHSTRSVLCRALAAKFNFSTKTIRQVWNRKSWTGITNDIACNAATAPCTIDNAADATEYGSSSSTSENGGRFCGIASEPSPSSEQHPSKLKRGEGAKARRIKREDEKRERTRTKKRRGGGGAEGQRGDVSPSSPSADLEVGRATERPTQMTTMKQLCFPLPSSVSAGHREERDRMQQDEGERREREREDQGSNERGMARSGGFSSPEHVIAWVRDRPSSISV